MSRRPGRERARLAVGGPAAEGRGQELLDQAGQLGRALQVDGVPGPGDERICMAYYYYRKSAGEPRHDTGVVIERFQYLP